jgi:hypothetical protein
MSATDTSLELSFGQRSSTNRKSLRVPAWAREPLLHFILFGGVLFAVDHMVAGRADDPRHIVVGSEVDSEAVEAFEQARGREPDEKELRALHQLWLDNEVLYREGLAMGLDKGDDAIRERVIFKALSVVDANVRLPEMDDARLRAWFEAHREKYDEPVRFDFQEAALVGEASEAAVRSFVTALNNGTPGDAQAGLRIFDGRPHASIVQSYGAEFARQLEAAPPGQWQALQTRDGWRAVRLEAVTPAKPAEFDLLHGIVMQDWKDAEAAEQRTAAVRALAKKYDVEFAERPGGKHAGGAH